ncbi:MAG: WbuC family cupin fold metalloprotein [Geobacter sp.]|nr:WbuC family cupin fold metalloprotein [Geobacter sp.]
MQIIDRKLLDEVSAEAVASPRRRKNRNLHPTDEFPCHRLFNAMEPGSYIRPHRHLDPAKDESMVMVRGRMGVLSFDEIGTIVAARVIGAGDDSFAVDIPHGEFHTVVSLEPGTVFFETKAGPYLPLTDAEKASWAPEENSPETSGYLSRLQERFRP